MTGGVVVVLGWDYDRAAFDLAHGMPIGEVSLLIPDHEFKRDGVRRILCGISVFEQKRNLFVVMDGANLDGLDRDLLDPLLPMDLGRQWKLCDGKRIPGSRRGIGREVALHQLGAHDHALLRENGGGGHQSCSRPDEERKQSAMGALHHELLPGPGLLPGTGVFGHDNFPDLIV